MLARVRYRYGSAYLWHVGLSLCLPGRALHDIIFCPAHDSGKGDLETPGD